MATTGTAGVYSNRAIIDADVPDTLTASNYLALAGGTLTGQLVTDNLGVELEESDTNPTCSSGNYNIYADLSEATLKKCINGVSSDLDSAGGGSGDVTAVGPGCATGACFTDGLATTGTAMLVWEGTTVDGNQITFSSPVADPASAITITTPGATTTIVGHDTTNTLTGKTLDAEGTGNVVTIPVKAWLPAAGCNNTTASAFWDLPTTNAGAAACVTGSNTQKGVLDFDATTDESAQQTLALPADFTGAIDARVKWLAAATSGSVGWCIQLICVADAETDDPAFPAQAAGNCVSDAAKGTTLQTNDAAITSVTATGCAAGELMHVQVSRDAGGSAVTDDMAVGADDLIAFAVCGIGHGFSPASMSS